MTVHQCPKCELRFGWKTEVDDHCWHDHPEFRHEYPAQAAPLQPVEESVPTAPHIRERRHHGPGELFGWLQPTSRLAKSATGKTVHHEEPPEDAGELEGSGT